jgi:hypothetical protein
VQKTLKLEKENCNVENPTDVPSLPSGYHPVSSPFHPPFNTSTADPPLQNFNVAI